MAHNADQVYFKKEVEKLIARVDELSDSISTSTVDPQKADTSTVLNQVLHEISSVAEELEVAQAELSAQQEELVFAQHAVVNEQLRYQNLFEFAQDGYLVTDTNGKIIKANRRAGELFLYHPRALAGKLLVSLVASEDRKQFRQNLASLQQIIQQVKNPGNFQGTACHGEWELCMRARTGAQFDASISYMAAREDEQTVVRWMVRDIRSSRVLKQNYRDLLRRLVTTQEEERQRISRELHDQMGQQIIALMLGLNSLESDSSLTPPSRETLQELRKLVKEISKEIHQIALDLRPAALDELGLNSALNNYLEEWSERYKIPVDYQAIDLHSESLDPQVSIAIYRVIQEALSNVIKHAQASHVSLIIDQKPSKIQVIVEDNGQGFDTDHLMRGINNTPRIGILGMKERVEQVGGEFNLESKAGKGTTIFIRIPLIDSVEATEK